MTTLSAKLKSTKLHLLKWIHVYLAHILKKIVAVLWYKHCKVVENIIKGKNFRRNTIWKRKTSPFHPDIHQYISHVETKFIVPRLKRDQTNHHCLMMKWEKELIFVL